MNLGSVSNELGQRGEAIFQAVITRFWAEGYPLFRSHFLGDKCPNIDFMVELLNVPSGTPFFFVQVKTTRAGYTKNARLKVQLGQTDAQQLAGYSVPTYVVGVDEKAESAYLIAVPVDVQSGFSSLSTAYALDEETQNALWQEVLTFWEQAKMPLHPSRFIDTSWR